MSAIQVEQIKHNRHETGGLKHIPVPFDKRDLCRRRSPLLRLRRLHVTFCADCDGEHKASTKTSTHARPRGGRNAQQFQIYPRRRGQALPDLRRQIRPRQALLLADRALFKEVR